MSLFNESPGNRALAYSRVSTVEQILGLASQEAALIRYCEFKGLDLQNIYSDCGVSGKHPLRQRPRGNVLWETLQRGDHFVVHKLDRAWRSAKDCLDTVELLEDMGVTLHIVDMGLDVGTPMGKFFITVVAAFAELERNMISQRTKEGLAASNKVGGPPPFGYNLDRSENPDEQATISYIVTQRGIGRTYREIGKSLLEMGVPTRSGTPWSDRNVRHIMGRLKSK